MIKLTPRNILKQHNSWNTFRIGPSIRQKDSQLSCRFTLNRVITNRPLFFVDLFNGNWFDLKTAIKMYRHTIKSWMSLTHLQHITFSRVQCCTYPFKLNYVISCLGVAQNVKAWKIKASFIAIYTYNVIFMSRIIKLSSSPDASDWKLWGYIKLLEGKWFNWEDFFLIVSVNFIENIWLKCMGKQRKSKTTRQKLYMISLTHFPHFATFNALSGKLAVEWNSLIDCI